MSEEEYVIMEKLVNGDVYTGTCISLSPLFRMAPTYLHSLSNTRVESRNLLHSLKMRTLESAIYVPEFCFELGAFNGVYAYVYLWVVPVSVYQVPTLLAPSCY